ncbi:MAG: ABC transporter permease [Chloroflexi bacterium]|nr:ABC transporter permease [Chloroflexota bacterium]
MSAQVVATPQTAPALPRVRSERVRLLRVFSGNRIAVFGLALSILVILAAIGAPLISPLDPFDQSAANRMDGPDAVHIMGRDTFGRDIFTRVLHAGRVSLLVGVGSVALGGVVGTLLGLIAGYSGRWVENLVMRAVDVLMAFPSLLLGLAVLAVLGAGLEKMIVAIGIVLAPPFARVVHGATLSLKAREFVEAARCLGAGQPRILGRHILPNLSGETVVLASLLTASAIRIEASLSFIGLGVSPPTPTWGNMIRDGAPLLLNSPWLSVFPGLAILITVLAFNLMGDGLRDVLDPRSQQ